MKPLPEAKRANRAKRASLTTARAALGWVVVFLAWHVVWYATGLSAPTAAVHHGAARVLFYAFSVLVYLMVAIGIAVPLALAGPAWGRRIPRRLLLFLAWAGSALLLVRGLSGVADDLLRATGVLRDGLTGLTEAQSMGTAHPSWWAVFAGDATDALFLAGGLVFGLAALSFQRLRSTG
ncbi:hypothetical protein ACEZDB_14500 [Streptacidiphilus sp. N1-3]|uniref:Uncharacterized protein n=1 Tax=Streptacidiphilus alkalitolerans TaxID=3342712 RepID=A0ABV6X0M7_9ACTN